MCNDCVVFVVLLLQYKQYPLHRAVYNSNISVDVITRLLELYPDAVSHVDYVRNDGIVYDLLYTVSLLTTGYDM